MKVAITGNVRKPDDESFEAHYQRVYALIEQAIEDSGFKVTAICCGRKNGVDRSAIQYAKNHNIPYEHFVTRYSILRADPDALIAFRDGSQGTQDVVEQMSRDGKLVHFAKH